MVLLLYCAVGYVNISDVNLCDLQFLDHFSHCSFLRNKLIPALSVERFCLEHFSGLGLEFQGPSPHRGGSVQATGCCFVA